MTDTTASLRLAFDPGFTEVKYDLDIYDGDAITQAHLHCGIAGSNGGVLAIIF